MAAYHFLFPRLDNKLVGKKAKNAGEKNLNRSVVKEFFRKKKSLYFLLEHYAELVEHFKKKTRKWKKRIKKSTKISNLETKKKSKTSK